MKARVNNLITRYENKYSMLKMKDRNSDENIQFGMISMFLKDLRALKE